MRVTIRIETGDDEVVNVAEVTSTTDQGEERLFDVQEQVLHTARVAMHLFYGYDRPEDWEF